MWGGMKKYLFVYFCIITTLYSMDNNNTSHRFITTDIDPDLFAKRIHNFETKLLPLAKNKTLSKIDAFFPHLEKDFETIINEFTKEQSILNNELETKKQNGTIIFQRDKKTVTQKNIKKGCNTISERLSLNQRDLPRIWSSFLAPQKEINNNRTKAIGVISLVVFLDYIIKVSTSTDKIPPYHSTGVHLAAIQTMTKCLQCAKSVGVKMDTKDGLGFPAIALVNKANNSVTYEILNIQPQFSLAQQSNINNPLPPISAPFELFPNSIIEDPTINQSAPWFTASWWSDNSDSKSEE